MVISQGEIWWADLPGPTGSGPGYRRPVVIIQGDNANRSRLGTTIVIPLTGNLHWAEAPGNLLLRARLTGLEEDSVANVSQVVAIVKDLLRDRTGKLPKTKVELVLAGLDLILGR